MSKKNPYLPYRYDEKIACQLVYGESNFKLSESLGLQK